MTIQIWDETLPGKISPADAITLSTGAPTLRDVIRSRVQQEVERYNRFLPDIFQGLVQPEEAERILNGFRMKTRKPLDWEKQFHPRLLQL